MTLYNLIGRRRCSAVSKKIVCKCFTASILALIEEFPVEILIEMNVNISYELIFFVIFSELLSTLGR